MSARSRLPKTIGAVLQMNRLPRAPRAGTVHAFDSGNTSRLFAAFMVASLPAAGAGIWNVGAARLANAGLPAAPLSSLAAGLVLFLPVLLASLSASFFWEQLFARGRGRTADPGWLMQSWLFALLLPASISPLYAALGMSFGAVFGRHLFGGSGHYIASPAIVGALFIQFSYPALLPGNTAWDIAAALQSAGGPQDLSWTMAAIGREGGAAFGTASALACVAGAAFLLLYGAVSHRTLLGALLGVAIAAAANGSEGLAAHWHFVLGSVAFCWAFVLTDPTTMPLTRAARWAHGALFGLLVVVIRDGDPARPEGTLFAVLLAGLLVPILDYLVLRYYARRHGSTLELLP